MCEEPPNATESEHDCGSGTVGSHTEECPFHDDHLVLVEIKEQISYNGSDHEQPVTGRQQWVNLDPAATGGPHFDHGRKIYIKAKVAWATSGNPDPLSGHAVHVIIEPDGGNRASLVTAIQHGANGPGSGNTRIATTDADGWTDPIALDLSIYGGDKFKFRFNLDGAPTGGIQTGEFEVWRKLWYEYDTMMRSGSGDYDGVITSASVESKLRAEKIELVSTGSNSKPPHKRVVELGDLNSHASGFRTGSGSPRFFHLVMMDTIGDLPVTKTQITTIPAAGGTATFPANNFTINPSNWLVDAEWQQKGSVWRTLPASNLTLTETGTAAAKNDTFVVSPNFTGLPKHDPTKDTKIKLKLRTLTERSGWQTGPSTNVAIRWRERVYSGASLTNSTFNTALHEAVHAFGLAASTKPDGTANGRYYFSNGGHCNFNTNDCIMYHANTTKTDFCDFCQDCLRGRNLSSLPLSGTAAYTG